ncbi:hypothetical protein HOO69_10090 [Vibrio europaeus]|uniref:Uncharacterized protein n=2 Tax=Vibrio europaeus TaxID=300876 RepID=A0AAE7AZR7_9VIBR|nr:hypothetical protein HOO69_10090 [Vibrio europaeus]
MGFGPRELAPKEEVKPKLSTKERLDQQRRENHAASENNWNQIQANNTEQDKAVAFALGWMQCEATQSQDELWESLFTSETTPEQKQLVKQTNAHLNNPVRQGEIVILPTVEPTNVNEKKRLEELIEEAKAGSVALEPLHEDEVATVYRYFELLDYYVSKTGEYIEEHGGPSDEFAYTSVGVGAIASGVESYLNHVNSIISEINDLYVSQVAMASRTGGINYGEFVSQRAELFKKLDSTFKSFSSRTVKLPVFRQVKNSLKLSTKSVVHNADEIIDKKLVPNLGKRMANIAKGVWGAKTVGHIGLLLGGASATKNIYDACSIDGTGDCGKTTTREVAGFFGGWFGGAVAGQAGIAAATLVLSVAGITSAPIVAIAVVGGAVAGGFYGGSAAAAGSKFAADFVYEQVVDSISEFNW